MDDTTREFATRRILRATPEDVFDAFRDPERLARWWGPKGFTNTFDEFALEPGGHWRFVMHGPTGGDYRNESVFAEVVPARRIVFQHVSPPRYHMTLTFEPHGEGTLLTWRQVFDTQRDADAVRRVVVRANEENLDRLEAELART